MQCFPEDQIRVEQLVPYATARRLQDVVLGELLCIGPLSASSPVAIYGGSRPRKARMMLGLGQQEARFDRELNTSARRAGFGIVANSRC